jgi:hypothetical protein
MKFSMMGQEKGDLNVSIIYIFFLWPICPFLSFGHCIGCLSSNYGLWLSPFGIFKLFWWARSCNVSIIYIFLLFADNTSNECQRSETIPCIDWRVRGLILVNIDISVKLSINSSYIYSTCMCTRKFHMNWTSSKRSPVLKGHFVFVRKVMTS